jgi:ribosomal protein S18 acetylase RimI-like enzyme
MMVNLIIRPAYEQDCRDIARLFMVGSQGLAEFVWRKKCRPEETVIDVGARRCARTGVPFSYENCAVVETEGKVVGLLHAYPMEPSSAAAMEKIEPVLRPFVRLKDVGSFYLSAVVVDSTFRGLGIGSRLLHEAHQRALRHGSPRLSVVVLERNEAAMSLYRRAGFVEIDRTPLVPHPDLSDWTKGAILLTKRV